MGVDRRGSRFESMIIIDIDVIGNVPVAKRSDPISIETDREVFGVVPEWLFGCFGSILLPFFDDFLGFDFRFLFELFS